MKYGILTLLVLAVVVPTANYMSSIIVDAVLLSAAGFLIIKYFK